MLSSADVRPQELDRHHGVIEECRADSASVSLETVAGDNPRVACHVATTDVV